MGQIRRIAPLLLAAILTGVTAFGQDDQALAEAARRAKEQKNAAQSQGGDAVPAKTPKLITNDDLPPRLQPVARTSRVETGCASPLNQDDRKISAAQWKSQIEGQKNRISNLQSQIAQLSESIRFAPARCVNNCVQRNERQLAKEQQVETMKAQLGDQRKKLEDMQEQARRQGYGNSVYDP